MIKKLIIKYLKNKHEFIKHQMRSLEVDLEYSHREMEDDEIHELVQKYEYWKNIELSFFETIKFLEDKQ